MPLFARPKILPCFLILAAVFAAGPVAADPIVGTDGIDLTVRERQWLAEHPIIRFAADPDYQPIESMNKDGQVVGISADYLKLLESRLGVRFQTERVPSWDEAMRKARSREVDVLSAATKSSTRSKYMSFTTPHIELPGVIIVRTDAGNFSGLGQFRGKKVGVVSSYIWQEWIARDHPGIDLQPVRDMQTGLLLVSFGQLDAMVGNLATATHHLKNLGITNLRVAAETGYFARLAIASRNDWPELNGILQKAVSSISPEEKRAILDKWIKLEAPAQLVAQTILFGVLIFIAVVIAAVGGNFLWNHSLRRMVRRQSETLRESENRFRAIVEDQTELIGRSLPHVHTQTFVNEAYCRYFGKTREELIGSCFMDHIPSEDRDNVHRLLETLSVENPAVHMEHRAVAADGRIRWHQWTNRAIFDDAGNIIEIQAVGRDITDSKLAEEALRESEQRYRQLIEASPDAILVTSKKGGKVLFANSTAVSVFAAESVDQLINMDMLDFVHPDYREDVEKRRGQALQGVVPPFAERKRLRLDGSVFYSESRGIAFTWAGKPAILIVIRDITERKQAEERLGRAQKMEAIGQLTGGVAHDFNNLLTVVLGNAQILKSQLGDGGSDESANAIIRAAQRGAELTQRLLAYSRRSPLSPKTIAVDELVTDMKDMLQRTLGETMKIETEIAENPWAVRADPGQLESAILNLAINARDAMPGGGSLVLAINNVRLEDENTAAQMNVAPGDYVSLSVSDTGTGMTQDVLRHAYEPFFTTKDVGKGSGLGLSMVHGFAAQSGGGVKIYSEEERGTRVTLVLPRASESDRETETKEQREVPPSHGETVLLVEDEPDVRVLTAAILGDLGYVVHMAGDGAEAIKAFENTPHIDLLLTDVVLPGGMSGPELANRIRSRRSTVKVMFMSGYPRREMQRKGVGNGDVETLAKPFMKRDLAMGIRNALDAGINAG